MGSRAPKVAGSDRPQISPYGIETSIRREGNENQRHDHQAEIATCMIYYKFSKLVPQENDCMDTSEEILYFDTVILNFQIDTEQVHVMRIH